MPKRIAAIVPVVVFGVAVVLVTRAWGVSLCSAYWTLGLYGWWPC